MGFFNSKAAKADAGQVRDLEGMVAAIQRSQAVIEFQLNGTILRANTQLPRQPWAIRSRRW